MAWTTKEVPYPAKTFPDFRKLINYFEWGGGELLNYANYNSTNETFSTIFTLVSPALEQHLLYRRHSISIINRKTCKGAPGMNALREAFSGTVFRKRKSSKHLVGPKQALVGEAVLEVGLMTWWHFSR